MALRTSVQPIERDIQFLLDDLISPEQRSKTLAEFARDEIEQAKAINRQALGREPPSRIFVDGRESDALESVQPNGVIVCDFQLIGEVLFYIDEQLRIHSPVGTESRPGHPGLYKRSHLLFADGRQVILDGVDIGSFPQADEYVFVNAVPYARKIERGSSSQAPDGVYQAVAALAQRKFRNVVRITFTFRGITRGERNPAISVRQRM
jgi:hypothetical protein